ncbi:MAG TPA: hypothetical protein VEX69_01260 [Candidatus Limnocylindria bacterium]|nr:hypothetical protein [Candidatus Limnocylindria bacterium]
MVTSRVSRLKTYFYFFMSLLIAAVVMYGFSFTIDMNLIHPALPRPFLLYIHAAVFSGWLIFFILQTGLVRTRRVSLHRRIGWFGVAMASSMVVLGVSTAIIMERFNSIELHQSDADSFLMIPLFDMVCFGSTFGLAALWRKKPEYHRRLMLVATCALAAASFGRFPEWLLPRHYFYSGVDLLIVLGVVRDLIVDRRVHPVYLYALPLFIVGQSIVSYTVFHQLPYWQKIAHVIMG